MIRIRGKNIGIGIIFLVICLVYIWLTMLIPGWGEWYYQHIYKHLSLVLSRISSLFPFSLSDCFIYGSIIGLLIYVIFQSVKRKSWKRILWKVFVYLAWVYVWFYIAWGLNYFRDDFYVRTHTQQAVYAKENFMKFLTAYTDSLNNSFIAFDKIDPKLVAQDVKMSYKNLDDKFGFDSVSEWQHSKPMLVTPLMSGSGILGYMGPFFSEYTLNKEILPIQYPFTYAHELAHQLGITSEAEANLYAHLICRSSKNPEIKFAGYMGILTYVAENAANVLSSEEFEAWKKTISPQVITLYEAKTDYWKKKYSPLIGSIQRFIYNLYLKGNNISSGHDNYGEVIALLQAIN